MNVNNFEERNAAIQALISGPTRADIYYAVAEFLAGIEPKPFNDNFTCNWIKGVDEDAFLAYNKIFDLGGPADDDNMDEPQYNQKILWCEHYLDMHEIRLNMLCLAAAMAEAGDL